jgi:hypothetical protein
MLPSSRFRWVALICVAIILLWLLSLRSRPDDYLPQIPIRRPLSSDRPSNPISRNITRTLVIPRLAEEDIGWVTQFLGNDNLLTPAIYTVDDPSADLTVPKNKGHEVMVYLTYIIDHYHKLSDVTMFMHSHQIAWHNNDLMDSSAVDMVRRLSSQKVMRDGYMNLRCHLDPGCPDHIHPVVGKESSDDALQIPEAVVIGKVWLELFPNVAAPPRVLSQPCCAQFALSKDRIQTIPLAQYVFYRDWLLQTPLTDNLSGRVWEYVCSTYSLAWKSSVLLRALAIVTATASVLKEKLSISNGLS